MKKLLSMLLRNPRSVVYKLGHNEKSVVPAFEAQYGKIACRSKTPHELACAALLDVEFYLKRYPDLAAAGVDPLEHYIQYGYAEGRLPRSMRSSDSDRAIREAIDHDPASRIAIELHMACEHVDLKRLLTAADLYVAIFVSTRTAPDLKRSFETTATVIITKFLRFEAEYEINSVCSAFAKLLSIFPDSTTIHALHAFAMFERGDLYAAKIALSEIQDIDSLPPEINRVCVDAMRQITDADLANSQQPPRNDLLLLDSAFPSKISSFRYGEFSTYLRKIESSAIHIRPDQHLFSYGESMTLPEQISRFSLDTGVPSSHLRRFDSTRIGAPKVAYCVFLNHADFFFTQIKVPSADHLIFTLYPGGGFALNDRRSDTALRRLCENPRLSKIITTQNVSHRYLVDGGFCEPSRILHIFGGIIPQLYGEDAEARIKRSRQDVLNVCFVAQRYSAIGAEKGYDVFAQVVAIFANSPDVHFHVVGGYDETIIDLRGAKNITFYGTRPASFFVDFYRIMDIILSPNVPGSHLDPSQPAYFDGFPTTTVVEAGLQGVAMFATDVLQMNHHLDGSRIFSSEELLIIDRDPISISDQLRKYINDRDALERLGENGRKAIIREFNFDRQMKPRLELLEHYLSS